MPIPSNSYFPYSLAERALWFQNFANQFAAIAVSLGFQISDIDQVNDDNDAVQWMAQNAAAVDAFEKSLTAYRKEMLEANPGSPVVALPPLPTYPAPVPAVDPGIFARLIALVERIRSATDYTKEDGELLGIVPAKPADIAPNDLQPDPSIRALPGNVLEVSFKRGKTEGITVDIELDNSGTWEHAGKFFKSPGEINIPQNLQATARSVKVRARYLLDNSAVGQYSEIDLVSTMP